MHLTDTQDVNDEDFMDTGNCRSINCLAWAGFALTNFVTIVAVFSAFGKDLTAPIQLASGFFLTAGAFFAIGWGLNEAAGSPRPIWLPINVQFYRKRRQKRKSENSTYAEKPRETFVTQAEYCNALGTGIWAIGVELLILSWVCGSQLSFGELLHLFATSGLSRVILPGRSAEI